MAVAWFITLNITTSTECPDTVEDQPHEPPAHVPTSRKLFVCLSLGPERIFDCLLKSPYPRIPNLGGACWDLSSRLKNCGFGWSGNAYSRTPGAVRRGALLRTARPHTNPTRTPVSDGSAARGTPPMASSSRTRAGVIRNVGRLMKPSMKSTCVRKEAVHRKVLNAARSAWKCTVVPRGVFNA